GSLPFPSVDHSSVAVFDIVDRGPHSFPEGTAVKNRSGLLSTRCRVAVHLIEAMSAVIDADRSLSGLAPDQQHDGIVGDFGTLGLELDDHADSVVGSRVLGRSRR